MFLPYIVHSAVSASINCASSGQATRRMQGTPFFRRPSRAAFSFVVVNTVPKQEAVRQMYADRPLSF